MKVNGAPTHASKMTWDAFIGALGKRPLVITVQKKTTVAFDEAKVAELVGVDAAAGYMMSGTEASVGVQLDDLDALTALLAKLQQYEVE